MIETEGAKGFTGIQPIKVSSQAYSFLFITYKRSNSQKGDSEEKEDADYQFYMEESGTVSTLIREAIEECKNGKPGDLLESELVGKHDFFHLLESRWVPELGTLVEKISQKFEKIHTKELIGVPCVAVDFMADGEYFVGNSSEEAWFQRENPTSIKLDPKKVYALMFVDLKKGLCDKKRRMSLPKFLETLICPESEPKLQDIKEETKESIKGFFLGYGIYELIFLLESESLEDLFVSVTYIRQCLKKKTDNSKDKVLARGTSTLVFTPRRTTEKVQEDDSSKSSGIEYSALVATETGADLEVLDEIFRIEKKEKKKKKNGKEDKIKVFERQGYYDIIVNFEESSFHRACKIIKKIRDIPGVLGTSTLIKVNEKDILKRFGVDLDGK